MLVHRKGTDDAIMLRLRMNELPTDKLLGMYCARDPQRKTRYAHDAKTRKAIAVVLRVRKVLV